MTSVLNDINSLNRVFLTKGSTKEDIKLYFKELSPEETKYWENRLNYYYSSCGCPQGAIAVILTLICFCSYLLLRPTGFHITWQDGAIALGLFIISGALGKIIGLKFGKRQFRETVLELKNILQKRSE